MNSTSTTARLAAVSIVAAIAMLVAPAGAAADADLSIDKRDSADPATVGTQFDYLIEVRNNGPDQATAVEVTDNLPNQLDFVSATATQGSCDNQGRRVTCALGTLANGATATVTIRVEAKRDGNITNTASVTGTSPPGGDPQPANNEDSEPTQLVGAPGGRAECAGRRATIEGTAGDDVITGTEGRDVIVAGGGADEIDSLGGNDVICAQGGNDEVRARGKSDTVRGGGGNDRIRGGGGADTLRGGAGRDRLSGGRGADDLNGGGANDVCIGGPGPDTKTRC